MEARIRAFDWSQTPVGPMERWPEALRTTLRVMLASRYPMFVWWGEALTNFYNDGYIPVLGARHPEALGRSARQVWHEIWDTVGPQAEQVLRHGRATYNEELFLLMERYGFREETYFTFSYSPVPGPDGVEGVFCACFEDTRRVVGERRLRVLRALSEATQQAESADAVCEIAGAVLAEHRKDVPFALLYLREEGGRFARLGAAACLEPGGPASPGLVALGEHEPWPLSATPLVEDPTPFALGGRAEALAAGPWPDPVRDALVLPIPHARQPEPAGWLVMGVSPLLRFDREYASFAQLLAGALASTLAGARAREDERRRAEALAELDRAKTLFFSNVSHEFRTPLTLMLGPLEDALAEQDEALGPRARERLSLAHRNSQRLLKLVNTLLDFARLEAGRIEAVYEPVDLGALTSDLASSFRAAVERAGLALGVACETLSEPVYVDREMWEKIVLNLLSNAFKFTFEGGIRVELAARGSRVELSVADTGTGIAASELPFLFERFRRVKGAKSRSDEGTGIGLALVEELARLHGGTVGVESVVGRGSRFTVSLPLGCAHLPADRIGAFRRLPSTSLGAGPFVEEALRWLPDGEPETPLANGAELVAATSREARVLVADDNADLREYLRRLLGRYWTVETAASGREALEAARKHPPDLVVADVMMPELDGFALLAALRAERETRAAPVILLSARAGEEARIQGLAAGADDYLVKPFNARELIAAVRAHIELARLRRETVDAAERAALRLRLLADLSATLSRTLEPGETLRQLARAVVPAVADWCFVDAISASGDVQRIACEAADPADAELCRKLATVQPDAARRDPLSDELRRGKAQLVEHADEAWCRAHVRDDARLQVLLAMALRSVVLVPLVAHGRHFGVLTFMTSRSGRTYTEEDLPFLEEIGTRTSLALENAHLFEAVRRESEESERARREAEAANRAKDDFLAVLSHELRAPLQSIYGWASLLKNEELEPAQARRAIESVERSARSQARLIGDLLEVSRIVTGRFAIDRSPVDVGEAVANAVEQLLPLAREKGVSLECEVSECRALLGDRERLLQVVTNLVSNAIRFTPRGGRVDVRCAEEDAQAVVVVRDTGAGIAPEFLPELFLRFTQADASSRRRHGGLGLGLAIARHIVDLHGGTIAAESAGPGQGATFTVRLPLAAGVREPAAARAVEEDGAPQLDGASVLLVEDDADSRDALAVALQRRGAHVRSAGSVREAIEACRAEPPELIVSDLGMPGEDGYALLESLRELGLGHLPVIALTGFAGAEDRRRALRTGFLAHVPKPVDSDALAKLVKRVLPQRRAG